MIFRTVNQARDLFQSNFIGPITKNKKHRVNHIGFARTIRAYNGSKTFVKWSQCLFSSIGFKVFILNMSDYQSGTFALKCQWRGWGRGNVNSINMYSTIFISNFVFWISLNLYKTIKKVIKYFEYLSRYYEACRSRSLFKIVIWTKPIISNT